MQRNPELAASRSHNAGTLPGLPPAIRLYLGSILLLSALTIVAFVHYRLAGYNTSDLWIYTDGRYRDLYQYYGLFKFIHTPAFFNGKLDHFAYPAPCAIVYLLLYKTYPHFHAVYVAFFLLAIIGSTLFLYRMLTQYGIARTSAATLSSIMMVTSYPWMLLFDRANLELFIYILLAAGFWAYLTGRKMLAAALWGCAGSMKIYPIVLLAMFLHRSTLRPLIFGLLTAAAVLVLSFWFVGPTITEAVAGTLHGVRGFVGHYAGGFIPLGVDHSILGAFKELFSTHNALLTYRWLAISKAYQVGITLGAIVLWFVRIRKLPWPNQLCLMLVASVSLPPVSYDYTLIHTYLAFGLVIAAYLSSVRSGRSFPAAKRLFVSFAILSTSQTWLQNQNFRLNAVVKCAALITIFVLLLRHPLTIDSPETIVSPNTEDIPSAV